LVCCFGSVLSTLDRMSSSSLLNDFAGGAGEAFTSGFLISSLGLSFGGSNETLSPSGGGAPAAGLDFLGLHFFLDRLVFVHRRDRQ